MSKWLIKTAVQRVVSWLPQSHKWNELLQKHVTKGLDLSSRDFESKLKCCRTHLQSYREISTASKDHFTVLELGTGWFPIVPLGLYLCGASEIWTYDLVPLLRKYTFKRMLYLFCQYDQKGTLKEFLPDVRSDRVANLQNLLEKSDHKTPERLLEGLNIHPIIGDARHTELAIKSIDLVCSTVVFEHVPSEVLTGLFKEFQRVSSYHAVMSHYIGMADQFANFDSSITGFNFLKFSDSAWRWLNNPMIPLTRLRIADYRKLVVDAGYTIIKEDNTCGAIEDLKKIKLAPRFRNHSQEDLLVLFSWIVARRNPAS